MAALMLDWLRWIAFAGLAVVGPGLALQRFARVPVEPALVVPLGLVACASAWLLALLTGQPAVAVVLLLGLDAVLLRGRRDPAPASARSLLPFVVVLVALLAFVRWPWNRDAADGSFVVDPLGADDAAFHAGLTWELTHAFPPQVPGLSGVPLGYHVGAGLVRAAAARLAGLEPYAMLTIFDPLLWTVALALALRALLQAMEAPPRAVALVPWTLLAGDLGWLWAAQPEVRFWGDVLRGNPLLALVLGNTLVCTMAMALGVVVALGHDEKQPRPGWIVLAAVLSGGTSLFKASVAAHLGLGLMVVLVVGRRRVGAAVALAALAAVHLALGAVDAPSRMEMALDPLLEVRATAAPWGASPGTGAALAAWTAFWVVASLGLRVLGVPAAVHALRSRSAVTAAAVMALAGWPLMLLLRVSTPDRLPWERLFDETAYFAEQAGVVLWAFTVAWLAPRLAGRRGVLVVVLCAALALPVTVQFVVARRPVRSVVIDAAAVQAVRRLRAEGRPGDVVLQRPHPRHPPAPMVLGPWRVPYTRTTPYQSQFETPAFVLARQEAVQSFFRTTDPAEARRVAAALDASWLLLYAGDTVSFDPRGVLRPVMERDGVRLFRVLR